MEVVLLDQKTTKSVVPVTLFQQCILSPKLRISNPLNLLQMVEEILLLVSVYIEAKNLCRLTIFISWTKNCQPSRPYPWFIFLLMLFIIFLVDF